MDQENPQQVEGQVGIGQVDPWAEAFAALDREKQEDPEAAAGEPGAAVPGADGADVGEGAPAPEAGDGAAVQDLAGGPGDIGGADVAAHDDAEDSVFRFTEEEAREYRESLTERIKSKAIRDVAAAYVKEGYRNTNGKLGATINDPDICKRDSDGVPRFYNPDTGREFSGDNPRRQAQEWVDDYNRELADMFNQTCADYSEKLMEREGVGLKVIEFAPKYEKLDPVRRAMFESIIEDYEVRDGDGDLIGYSCDLDKALAAVNRQVRTMQERFKSTVPQPQAQPQQPSGPALDMKSANHGSDAGRPEFKSVAEAMEYQQDQLLKKMREKSAR